MDIIVCTAGQNLCIGYKNTMPWPKLSMDLKHFRYLTVQPDKKNICIVGRKTFDTLPKPFKNRLCLVLTREILKSEDPNVIYMNSWDNSMSYLYDHKNDYHITCIGGAEIYKLALPFAKNIYQTDIYYDDFPSDTFFPKNFMRDFKLVSVSDVMEESNVFFRFLHWSNQQVYKTDECQYMDLIQSLVNQNNFTQNRTGIQTISSIGHQMVYDLKSSFPLFTTKKMIWKNVVEELLWMLSGSTDVGILEKKGIHFWTANSTREFLDKQGLQHYQIGDIGPTYGFQWRYQGANYVDCKTNYKGQGMDQLAKTLYLLKTNPNDRRIIVNLWYSPDLSKMALPPCAYCYEFYVEQDHGLTCIIVQRSMDIGLGGPHNVAFGALLTYIFAKICNLWPKKLVHQIGNAHIYINQLKAMKEQCTRQVLPQPQLHLPLLKTLDNEGTNMNEVIDDLLSKSHEDFKIMFYRHHPYLKMDMAV